VQWKLKFKLLKLTINANKGPLFIYFESVLMHMQTHEDSFS